MMLRQLLRRSRRGVYIVMNGADIEGCLYPSKAKIPGDKGGFPVTTKVGR